MENNAFLETKKKTLGYLTGLSLILLAVTAILNVGMIRGENLAFLSQGSAQEPIGLNFGLRLEAFIWMLVVLLDLVISLTLYSYFKKEKPLMSLVSSSFRFLYTAMLAAGVLSLVQAVNTGESLALWQAFDDYWALSLFIFGFHLVALGFMLRGYQGFPGWLAWLILLSGFGYSGLNAMVWLWPQGTETLDLVQMIIALPLTISELGIAVWFFLPKKQIHDQTGE
jgi:hypothetical protein